MSAGATCGCCAGLALATPVAVENRPGLNAIAYRIGTHPQFKASLLARLAHSNHGALRQLRTRQDDDLAIALFDGWATIADVLTFYQERIANESYLRTATERQSVAELARLIDYALRAGVAANTPLAFTIEAAAGAPQETTIPLGTKVMSVPGPGEKPQTFETVSELSARGAWNQFRVRTTKSGTVNTGDTSIALDGVDLGLSVGDRVLFVGAGRATTASSTDWQVRTLTRVDVDREHPQTVVSWTGALPALGAPVMVYALRQRTALMGHNAPDPKNLASTTSTAFATQFASTVSGTVLDWTFPLDGARVYLDGVFPAVLPGDFLLLENETGFARLFNIAATRVLTRSAFTLSLRTTRLTLNPNTDLAQFHGTNLRGTTAFTQREALPLAAVPVTDAVAGDAVVLDSATDLPAGRLLLVHGSDADTGDTVGETVTLQRVEPSGATSRLVFSTSLLHRYVPESVVIFGNVAPATHGETVREVLGSGDGSKPYQRLKLKQSPLTFVPAKSATGAASSLELRVNGLLWHEVRTLYEAEPYQRVYTARQEDDGTTVVQFGDGVNGARLPTGRENVTAVYRKGIGLDGLLAPQQLSQLITRPLGAKAVTNPLPAAGAEAPESVDAARVNCTLTIHTLDRVVSLVDYEDFARAFGGVAKSLATWFWDGKRRGVFLTVAGTGGAEVDLASELRANLIAALRAAGDPHIPVDVRSYTPRLFGARIAITTASDQLRATVLERVHAALLAHFGFAARALAQPVAAADVLAVVQAVDGVVAAHLTRLHYDDLPGVEPRLAAAGPLVSNAVLIGAELLQIEPAHLELAELT